MVVSIGAWWIWWFEVMLGVAPAIDGTAMAGIIFWWLTASDVMEEPTVWNRLVEEDRVDRVVRCRSFQLRILYDFLQTTVGELDCNNGLVA